MNDREGVLRCFLGGAGPCSYLPGRESRSLFVDPQQPMNGPLYGRLLDQGFRRSGNLVYRHHCHPCQRCIALRLPVQRFAPRRRQRRVWRRWQAVQVIEREAAFEPRHFELYRDYIASRHPEGGMADPDPQQYRQFLISDWCDTRFLEFHLQGELRAVAVTDRVPRGLSAVYTFYRPDSHTLSPGVFTLLWQIHEARRLGLPWLYLGFWIAGCRKMEYKAEYRPLQALFDGHWQEYPAGSPLPVPP